VVFDETIFPFLELHPNARAQLRSEIMILPPMLISLHSPWHAIDNHVINIQNLVEEYAEHIDLSNGAASSGDFMQDQGTIEDLSARPQEDSAPLSPSAGSRT
jgi:hypothetical protein